MKKLIVKSLLIALVFFTSYSITAQVVVVPEKTKEHFAKKYPKAEGLHWSNNVVYYIGKFTQAGKAYEAHYNMDGTYNFTSQYVDLAKIPKEAKESYSKSRFAEWKVLTVAIIYHGEDENLYRIEVKKGIEKKYVYFNAEGKEVKTSITL